MEPISAGDAAEAAAFPTTTGPEEAEATPDSGAIPITEKRKMARMAAIRRILDERPLVKYNRRFFCAHIIEKYQSTNCGAI
jgi:hypothetical protein